MIIGSESIEPEKGDKSTFGYLINVAELFEIYVRKLLAKEFPSWQVSSQKVELYRDPEMFYHRKIIPDIILQKNNDVMVFDTKYKRMLFRGKDQYGAGDLDRVDFFQINTYMSYYQNHNFNVKVGGLLYPIEAEYDESKCHSDHWFGNSNTKFIVDGIDLSKIESKTTMEEIAKSEKDFIERIRGLINQT